MDGHDAEQAGTPVAAVAAAARPETDWDALVDELGFLADHDPQSCLDLAAGPLELARAQGLAHAEMRVSLHVGLAHLHLGQDSAALAAADRTAHLAERASDLVWQSRALV